jgi:vesicle-associated membrane protein 72
MNYCVEHPDEVSKVSKVKAQVSEVKNIMMDNIEKVSALSSFPLSLYLT